MHDLRWRTIKVDWEAPPWQPIPALQAYQRMRHEKLRWQMYDAEVEQTCTQVGM